MAQIVIADDEPHLLMLLQTTLQSRGYQVRAATNGIEALKLILADPPDAAILDLNMPGLDGPDVCRQVRADPRSRDVAVVFLSAYDDEEHQARAFAAGADDYLVKPFTPRELRTRLEAVIARRATNGSNAVRTAVTAAPPVSIARNATTRPDRGQIVAWLGVKGGVGTSALAVNLAVSLVGPRTRTALVDLDIERAVDNILLDLPLPQTGTIADLARAIHPEFSHEDVRQYLVPHRSGMHFLFGPQVPVEVQHVGGQRLEAILRLLRDQFHFVVVDLASGYRDVNLEVLKLCDSIILVVTPEIPAIKLYRTTTDVLRRLKVPTDRIQVVVNQTAPTVRLTLADVRKAIGPPLSAIVPFGGPEFTNSYNLGKPFVLAQPQHAASQAIKKLAAAFTAPLRA